MKPPRVTPKPQSPLYGRIRQILESARFNVARSVNTAQVVANWLIGREIVEEEQKGKRRADYGKQLIEDLAARLQKDFGKGYSSLNLWLFRRFYLEDPSLGSSKIPYAARKESEQVEPNGILDAMRQISDAAPRKSGGSRNILYALPTESWKPGRLPPDLSWTHYRTLLRVDKPEARSFYEIEALKNNWSARELERRINSLLYERLALSKDKKGLMKLATQGHEVQQPADIFKDPVVMEFLGLPESPKLVETNLEEALINNLQAYGQKRRRGEIHTGAGAGEENFRQPLQTASADGSGA